MIRAIPRNIQPKSEFMSRLSRQALERNSEYMSATGLPSLLCPMWIGKTLEALRAKHGATPAFFNVPRLIGFFYGEQALELFNAVMQLKNAIRLLEEPEAQK